MAELSDADILRILELVDQSSFDYFQLTLGDLHLTVSKTGLPAEAALAQAAGAAAPASAAPAPPQTVPPSGPPPPPPAAPAPPASPGAQPPPAPGAPPAAGPPTSAAPTAPDAGAATGLVAVPAPMVGTFYVAPAPDAPPFVEVGAAVEESTTVGLVEAMKVFTGVLAGTRGVVAQRLVENAQFVEYNQPLFLIRPESA
ncbi:MAG TPA: biotin/lipoyl-containing protein [Chloroflexota bacterium]|nr:biotin/lipoyl-containing protein [Chloroflexota bacterium]